MPPVPDPPAPSWRVVLAIVALGAGWLLSGIVAVVVIAAGDWDLDVPAELGNSFGRLVGQRGVGAPLDHNRVPLTVSVLLNIPLWASFVGLPWIAARAGRLDWRRDLRWAVRRVDAPVGFVVGVVTQLVVVPLIYSPLLPFIDGDALEEPARDLVAGATTPLGVTALVVLTVVGAPIAEEILFRGLLFGGLVDMAAGRRFGVTIAVVASSVIFAASHLQPLQFPGLFVIGAVAALGLHRTGRLGTAIWIHVGFNATTVAILLNELY